MQENAVLSEQIYLHLRNAILEGRLKVGERLKQDELAGSMNVSRMPVREALQRLEEEGLITVVPHKGAWVTHFKMEHIIEVYLLRKILEKKAVELATPILTPEDLAALIAHNRSFAVAVSNRNSSAMIKTNEEFHFALYEKSGFPYLTQIIAGLWNRFPRYTFNIVAGQGDKSVQEHWDIMDAVSRGHVEEAGELMRCHVEKAQQGLILQIQKEEG